MSLVDLFSALADPTRCRVVEMLHERSRPVHELAAAFDISRPAISRHLKVLKDAGLVIEEKSGRENLYSLQRPNLKPMQDWLEKHRTAPTKKAARQKAVAAPEAVAAAPAPAIEPTPVPEPIVAPPEPVVATPAPEPAKPRRTPRAPRPPVVAPPPAAAPQLSFFDL
jgi:DNA-binding transcriptional ArsR family regulator